MLVLHLAIVLPVDSKQRKKKRKKTQILDHKEKLNFLKRSKSILVSDQNLV